MKCYTSNYIGSIIFKDIKNTEIYYEVTTIQGVPLGFTQSCISRVIGKNQILFFDEHLWAKPILFTIV